MSSTTYILAIDQGTTMTTALLLAMSHGPSIQIVAKSSVGFPQYYPQSDWVEHDLTEVWNSVAIACQQTLQAAKEKQGDFPIASIGITNQRETLCIYDRTSLRPLRRSIVWQCKRSHAICEQLKQEGHGETVRQKTGLLCDPYFTASKLRWAQEDAPEIRTQLEKGTAIVGTVDTFLLSKLTGGAVHATEPSNASRTLWMNIHTGKWDEELLQIFSVPNCKILPEIRPSAGIFGYTSHVGFLPDGIPISGILGDQQAALAGQACFATGQAKCTYGTGAFLLRNTGHTPIESQHGLLTTVAWQTPGAPLTYALEGASFIAGAAVQFIRDGMGWIDIAQETETAASQASAAPDIYFVPALSGLGAPWWVPNAKGALLGLTRSTSRNQLIRATLEGICFQICDLIAAMEQDVGQKMQALCVDGGATENAHLLQIQANFAGIPVERPQNLDTTALGAALFAALGLGIFASLEEMRTIRALDRTFYPQQDEPFLQLRGQQLGGWKRAVQASIRFTQD